MKTQLKEYQIKGAEFAEQFADEICKAINEKVPDHFKDMPYARQYVLEVLIDKLQERV